MSTRRKILNPTQGVFTPQEQEFIKSNDAAAPVEKTFTRTKSRNISMRDEIWDRVTQFIHDYPSEGSHSGVIARAVSDYIRRKESEYRNT